MASIKWISESYLCSACGACYSVCSKKAISFSDSSMGRKFAVVSNDCIECGLCMRACPTINYENITEGIDDKFVGNVNSTYIGRAVDENIFANAQSGGACTAILQFLFDYQMIDCAVVCKMEYGEIPQVSPIIITNPTELHSTQKSNYTQIDLLSILDKTKEYQSVAIVGLPCHIEGVKSIQKNTRKYLNIKYALGLICDRSLCGTLQDVYKSYSTAKKIKICWRAKLINNTIYPYKNAPLTILSETGESTVLPNVYRFALKDMFTPPRCRTCKDKLNILADITLGDPWKMSNVDWENGASLIITRTEIGRQIVDLSRNNNYLKLQNAQINEAIKGQNLEQRKQTSEIYQKALEYVLSASSTEQNATTKKNAVKTIQDFVSREQKSKEEIIKEARWEIKKTLLLSSIKQFISKLKAFTKHKNYPL